MNELNITCSSMNVPLQKTVPVHVTFFFCVCVDSQAHEQAFFLSLKGKIPKSRPFF